MNTINNKFNRHALFLIIIYVTINHFFINPIIAQVLPEQTLNQDSVRLAKYLDTLQTSNALAVNIQYAAKLGEMDPSEYSLSQIDSLFSLDSFDNRIVAIYILINGKTIDTATAVNIIKNELLKEIEKPLSNNRFGTTEFSISEVLKRNYCEAIAQLLQNDTIKILSLMDSLYGEANSRLIVILSGCGAHNLRGELRKVLINEPNGNVRFLASCIMNKLPDTLDIPYLLTALEDTFYVTNISGYRFYRTRINASCALQQLRYEFNRSGDYLENYIITKEPNK